MRNARLTLVEGDLALLCDHNPDLVTALKSWIPEQWRAWDFDRRLWRVHRSQEPTLREVLRSFDYMVDDRRLSAPAPARPIGRSAPPAERKL